MNDHAVRQLNLLGRKNTPETPALTIGATFPDAPSEGLSEAEFEYQELLAEEDFSLERFKYSLLLTLMLWLVLFAAWGLTQLVL